MQISIEINKFSAFNSDWFHPNKDRYSTKVPPPSTPPHMYAYIFERKWMIYQSNQRNLLYSVNSNYFLLRSDKLFFPKNRLRRLWIFYYIVFVVCALNGVLRKNSTREYRSVFVKLNDHHKRKCLVWSINPWIIPGVRIKSRYHTQKKLRLLFVILSDSLFFFLFVDVLRAFCIRKVHLESKNKISCCCFSNERFQCICFHFRHRIVSQCTSVEYLYRCDVRVLGSAEFKTICFLRLLFILRYSRSLQI